MLVVSSQKEFLSIFRRLQSGDYCSPRGQTIIEVENFNYELSPFVRFQNFKCRNFKVSYAKREVLWYIVGDKFDTSICEHAKMWKSLVNEDGSINSNYGQYIFGEQNQFDNVVAQLVSDPDSRRASIVILNREHLMMKTNDVPCTYSLNFRIRNNKLNMSVNMRSQDAIFGMGNDAPAFSIIHEMVLNALRETYPGLEYGIYHHSANSFHCYERHFEMLNKICHGDDFEEVNCPEISGPEEVKFLRKNAKALCYESVLIPEKFAFTRWLTNF